MKQKVFKIFAAIVFLACVAQANAKVWRVNNIIGVSADFSSMSSAISGAAADDTLYIEGSPISYGNVTLTKRLVILGTGYFISDNDSTQANPAISQFGTLTITSASAQGSVIAGISMTSNIYGANTGTLTIGTNNILISRCYIHNDAGQSSYSYYGWAVYINSGVSNVVIEKSYIYQERYGTSSTYSYYTYCVELKGNNTGIILMNNIIKHSRKSTVPTYGTYDYAITMATTSSAQIINNVIIGAFRAYNSTVTNNIQIREGKTGSYITDPLYANITKNNIGHSTQFGTSDGNQSNVLMTDVFTYGPSNEYSDNHYMLKAGSPAIGVGLSGEDCGAFGGINKYKLSGLPAIPAIFDATVPATATTSGGINVNIKAKTHK